MSWKKKSAFESVKLFKNHFEAQYELLFCSIHYWLSIGLMLIKFGTNKTLSILENVATRFSSALKLNLNRSRFKSRQWVSRIMNHFSNEYSFARFESRLFETRHSTIEADLKSICSYRHQSIGFTSTSFKSMAFTSTILSTTSLPVTEVKTILMPCLKSTQSQAWQAVSVNYVETFSWPSKVYKIIIQIIMGKNWLAWLW